MAKVTRRDEAPEEEVIEETHWSRCDVEWIPRPEVRWNGERQAPLQCADLDGRRIAERPATAGSLIGMIMLLEHIDRCQDFPGSSRMES